MSSEISYKKEFEDVILKQNPTKALSSLIPNSPEYVYLQFCLEYKKCVSEQRITPELISILETLKKEDEYNSYHLLKILDTRKNLLEYDLPSTSQKRRNSIIEELYQNYCGKNLDYEAPYFVREKEKQKDDMIIDKDDDNGIIELNDDLIRNEIEKQKNTNKILILNFEYTNTNNNKRNELLLKYIENDSDTALYIIQREEIPFYIMTKEDFSKVIEFYNNCKEEINNFDKMTWEQIERMLKEVDNPKYISKKKMISKLMSIKYKNLLNNSGNNLTELKKVLFEIYSLYIKYAPNRCSEVLLSILIINKRQDIIDVNLFIEYLKYKKLSINKELDDYEILDLSDYIENIPFLDISKINIKDFLEEILIDVFIKEKATIENFSEYYKDKYLNKIFYISKLLKGEESLSPIDDKYLTYSEYCELANKKEITICGHNPSEFQINEDIKIDLQIKNIKVINISIYEINTENYFLEKKTFIDGSINIEGLIASQIFDVKIEGGENPLKRIRKTIELNQIPKNKPGVYLIDILGEGISSRIIIKKGKLNLIYRNTTKGIMCQIINEKNKVLKDSKTFLWYRDMKLSCEPNEGLIILPYKILSHNDNKCILVHDSYADIAQISIEDEEFELRGYFHFLNESLIWGMGTKVTFRPFLFVNGRECPVDNIKNGTIIVEMKRNVLNEDIPIKTEFKNIEFNNDNKEYEFEIFIPSMISSLEFRFKCEIINSKGEKKNLSYYQDSEFNMTGEDIYKGLFRKSGKNYFYENIGRNGEKITKKAGDKIRIQLLFSI